MSKTKLFNSLVLNLLVFFIPLFSAFALMTPLAYGDTTSDSGPCDTSIDPKTNQPKHTLTDLQKRSCAVDGTPNLTEEQIKSAEACKKGSSSCLQNNVIIKRIQEIVNFLSAAVALVVTGAIIVGGIQYSMAGDKAEAVTAAKKRITNGLIALLAFIFTFAFLQWLIPGGVFG